MIDLYGHYPELKPIEKDIKAAENLLIDCYKNDGKVLCCGNGGSCADCEHIVGELMKGFLLKRPMDENEAAAFDGYDNGEHITATLQKGLPAISLPSQCAILSAYNNDCDPELVYAQLTYGYGREGDVLIGLSTSGNSKNVINAFKAAKAKGVKTIGMCGGKSCQMDDICDVVIHAPSTDTYRIQEYHLPIYHLLCANVEAYFFNK
ncbi:MAG: SIS domain-containing protein [Oscillospiraceae bacterium]|nr:SIS domain-containing protein [Candidatus Equicaccousia limihippi]